MSQNGNQMNVVSAAAHGGPQSTLTEQQQSVHSSDEIAADDEDIAQEVAISVASGTLQICSKELVWMGHEVKEQRTLRSPAITAEQQEVALRIKYHEINAYYVGKVKMDLYHTGSSSSTANSNNTNTNINTNTKNANNHNTNNKNFHNNTANYKDLERNGKGFKEQRTKKFNFHPSNLLQALSNWTKSINPIISGDGKGKHIKEQELKDPGNGQESSSQGSSGNEPVYFLSIYTDRENVRFYPVYEDEVTRLYGYFQKLTGMPPSSEQEIIRYLLVFKFT